MSANPISSPKIAIVASLLMGGVLTIAALELRPDGNEASNDQPSVESRLRSVPATQDGTPPAGSQTTGSVNAAGESDTVVTQVLDAVQFCLDRNDLESAKVLLAAELALHKDDPRVQALQRQVQAREAGMASMPTAAPADNAAPVPLPPLAAARPASRAEHSRYAELPSNDHATSPSRYARTKYTPRVEVATGVPQRVVASSAPAANVETAGTPATAAPAAVALSPSPPVTQTAAAPPPMSPPAADPAPVAQSVPIAQPAQPAPAAQTAPPATTVAQSGQGPKTRDEVRMELERARSNGDLPRFGNPDPAGPGGALSMTVNPSAASH